MDVEGAGRSSSAVEDRTSIVDGIEVRRCTTAAGAGAVPLVLLHEGLGSAALWRGFAPALAAAARRPVLAWSRPGHGRSRPARGVRGPDYLHRLADRVPGVLRDVLGVERAVLVGHSDGATIALLHAAVTPTADVPGVVAIAPHVTVEQAAIDGIRRAVDAHEHGDLAARLARHHDDGAALFTAWQRVWTSPAFRGWDVTGALPTIDQRLLLVQAQDDEYGTLGQLDLVEDGVSGPTSRLVLAAGGHAPHLTEQRTVVDAIVAFVAGLTG